MSRGWRRALAVLGVTIAALALAATLAWRDYGQALDRPVTAGAPALFEIAPGSGGAQIAAALHARGWLARPLYFRLEARRTGLADRLQAGTYEVRAGDTPRSLLERFARGDVKSYTITLVEGSTVRQVRAQLASAPGLVPALAAVPDSALMRELGMEPGPAEGQLFPATYDYRHGSTDRALLARAHAKMQQVLAAAWAAREPGLPYDTPYEALIMASLIEKETAVPDERAAIAGVFVRRLRAGMRLQTDPTVIYGLGEAFDGNLTRAHLQADSPYNTYTRGGVPPTPIALPGAASIHAALHPAPGDALYFVARGDGSHEFSPTLEAHNAAVRRFQIRSR